MNTTTRTKLIFVVAPAAVPTTCPHCGSSLRVHVGVPTATRQVYLCVVCFARYGHCASQAEAEIFQTHTGPAYFDITYNQPEPGRRQGWFNPTNKELQP